ncbi:MAG: hypothetical protein RRA35_05330, partial [Desulfomonilia bacterium]|nr:hypothetical protein [Desulfomonilia bacterium]
VVSDPDSAERLFMEKGIPHTTCEVVVVALRESGPGLLQCLDTLMIAEMVNVGATVREAFVSGLQLNPDILETVLLSLHLELGNKDRAPRGDYQLY